MIPSNKRYEITTHVSANSHNTAIAVASRILAYGDHSDTFFQVEIIDVTVKEHDDRTDNYSVVFTIQDRFTESTWQRFETELTDHLRIVENITVIDKK